MAAEVTGLDLRQLLDTPTRNAVLEAFHGNQILVFRDQDLTKDKQIAFTEQFGTLERHALSNRGTSDSPFVHLVTNLDAAGRPTGKLGSTRWHSDKSFRPAPSMATILHAKILPPNGGDTCFANMYAAYEALDEVEKGELDALKVVHSWELSRENIDRKLSAEEIADAPPQTHPLARVHPETGRKGLFMGMHASHLEGMDMAEGRARIEALEAHATQERFTYRHNWRVGDLLMWDNRCLLHRADQNFDVVLHPRVLHRTCLRGTPTV
jgi:alpha-ketoglutarate-dependent taurine dioxygenase